jgi:hypothetical protein
LVSSEIEPSTSRLVAYLRLINYFVQAVYEVWVLSLNSQEEIGKRTR